MHFGNEIKILSDRFSYCLFETDWVDQHLLSIKLLVIFSEQLKQPQQMTILKLYPIDLETFTRVCIKYIYIPRAHKRPFTGHFFGYVNGPLHFDE